MRREHSRLPPLVRGQDLLSGPPRPEFVGTVVVPFLPTEQGIADFLLGQRRPAAKDRIPSRAVEALDIPAVDHSEASPEVRLCARVTIRSLWRQFGPGSRRRLVLPASRCPGFPISAAASARAVARAWPRHRRLGPAAGPWACRYVTQPGSLHWHGDHPASLPLSWPARCAYRASAFAAAHCSVVPRHVLQLRNESPAAQMPDGYVTCQPSIGAHFVT